MNTQTPNQNARRRTILWSVLPVFVIVILGANTIYLFLLAWLTWRVTRPIPTEETEQHTDRPRLWAQIGVLLIIIFLTGLNSNSIPLWSNMVTWFYNLGESFLIAEWFGGPGNSIANPVQYFVIPIIFLLLLGAKPAELGFGKGNKVWQACLIIGNTFQNGFFEEFLFRGALQTRLRRVMSTPWALTIQAVIFGLWHLRANTQMMDGNVLAGLAVCLVSQAVSGFVYGYVYQRTKNLIVPSVAHVAMNVLGQSFR